jgi:kynurenine formamidase
VTGQSSAAAPYSPIGALDRIDPATVLTAVASVRDGRIHDLGLDLGEHVPQGNPGAFVPFSLTWRTTPEGCGHAGSDFAYAAEAIIGTPHVGTHIDGLAHVVSKGLHLRRLPGQRGSARPRLHRARHGDRPADRGPRRRPRRRRAQGPGRPADGYEITVADLRASLDRAGERVRRGDVVLVRTGKVREYYTDAAAYQAGQPGVGVDAAVWLYEQGMAVLGTDTTGSEPLPFADPNRTTHSAMLVDRGVHLLENLDLDAVAAEGVRSGLFVCLPLRITGATGSWVRPILMT